MKSFSATGNPLRKLPAVLLPALLATTAQAQNGSLHGQVTDQATGQPLPYATVSLYKATDSSLAGGALAGTGGSFSLGKLEPGSYYLVAGFVGYQKKVFSGINLTGNNKINIGNLAVVPEAGLLNAITVSGRKASAYNKIDKQVYAADQFEAAKGGTALDVVRNMPSVSVNGQGEITFRGSGGFSVFLNGKPVLTDAQTLLSQLPANGIENIELITAPSAKYDPDGKAGIINIVTRKGTGDGFSAVLNAQGGLPAVHTYDNQQRPVRFGADATLGYKKGSWDLSAGLNYLRNDAGGRREGDVRTSRGTTQTSFPSVGERSYNRYNYAARLSATYTADKQNVVSLGLYTGYKFQARIADLWYTNTQTDLQTKQVTRQTSYYNDNTQTKKGTFALANFDYTHTFRNRSALTASLLYEYAGLRGNTQNLNTPFRGSADTTQYTYNTYTNPIRGYRAGLNYALPIGKGQWESGYLYRQDHQDGNFRYRTLLPHSDQYVTDPAFSSDLTTENRIHAVYSQYAAKTGALEYNGGLRYEYAQRDLYFSRDAQTNQLDLKNLFPSASLLYTFTPGWKAKAAYSSRVKRATNSELNPLPEREHSETLEQGDPNILPELAQVSELGIIREGKKGSVFTTLYHQRVKNPIQRVNQVYNDTILLRLFTNAGKADAWGAEAGLTQKPASWLQFYLGANVYRYTIKGSIFNGTLPVHNSSWVYSVNSNASVQLTKTFSLGASVNYLSERATAQGEDSRFLTPHSFVKKTFLNGRLSAQLLWQNMDLGLLGANQQRISTWGKDFYTTTNYVYETDVFLLNLSFNLNKLTKKLKLPSSEFGEKEF
ncbi:TonB-dependent receptor [Paraflavisolibacter sp. H34]|uniref:TonB-dependent receptor domain-containing protein n=1 Tax=Huijunlia imazamoxiresistens TaxID=3127457 RepID=UPI00301A0E3E